MRLHKPFSAPQTDRILIAFIALSLAMPAGATAHVLPRADLLESPWNSDPVIAFNLTFIASLYLFGVHALRSRSSQRALGAPQVLAFALGIAALAAALLSPLDRWSAELLSAHMIQHMIVMNLAAPLLLLGAPARVLRRGLPPYLRAAVNRRLQKAWRALPRGSLWCRGHRWGAWLVYALALWLWHLPVLYQAALRSGPIHDLQHLTLFAAAMLFWHVVLDRRPASRFMAIWILFTTSLHATMLGALMTLAPRVWYTDYISRTSAWSLTALEDQQLAGLIMWMPACTAYAIAAAALIYFWLNENRYDGGTAGASPH